MATPITPEAVVAHMREGEGPTKWLGIALEFVDVGVARTSMVVTETMLNGLGAAHGGMLFTLADTTFAYACNSRNVATVGQATTMVFLSPGRLGETLTANASEMASAGRTGVYDVRITGEDGRVVAIFQGQSRALGRPVIDADAE